MVRVSSNPPAPVSTGEFKNLVEDLVEEPTEKMSHAEIEKALAHCKRPSGEHTLDSV